MNRWVWLVPVSAAVVLLAGCGSADDQGSGDKSPKDASGASATVGRCAATAPAVQVARTIATVDLDGDGTGEAVRLTAATGDCPNTVFAKLGSGFVTASANDGPPAVSGFGVQIPGRTGQLLVTKSDHPRGGYQLRVYAAGTSGLTELQSDGHPLVPFVATDVQEHPLSIDCGEGGLVLTEAVPHEPAGVAAAWDVKRTTYAVNGSSVQAGPTQEVADNVLPSELAATYPDLPKYAAFTSCRATG
jgi:hypothetical protein